MKRQTKVKLLMSELVSLRRPRGPSTVTVDRAEAPEHGVAAAEQCWASQRWAAQQAGAAATLSSHGPAENASVATGSDEYHMLGSCCYKVSYIAIADE